MQQKIQKISLIVFLSIVITTGGAGCYQYTEKVSATTDSGPFHSDRVVEVRIVMSDDNWEFLQENALAEQYVRADLWYDGEFIPDIAVRTKGNSSLRTVATRGSLRFGLKADLNFFNSARSLYGVKKLNFNNGFSDPTLIREVLAYKLYEQMGLPAPRTSFVDLWINDTHMGLYTMVEQIDKTFITNNFNDNTGNLYKPEMPAAYLAWTEADIDNSEMSLSTGDMDEMDVNLGGGNLKEIMRALDPRSAVDETERSQEQPQGMVPGQRRIPPQGWELPEGMMPREGMEWGRDIGRAGMFGRGNLLEQMALKTNENNADHALLFRLLDVLNNEPDETFPEEIEKVMDVDEVLRFLAVSTVIVHLDNYTGMGHNYYLYENDGKFVIIPWDLNMAFGTFNSGLDRDRLINFYIDEPTAGPVADRPLVDRLLSYQPYLDAYHGYIVELLDGPFDVNRMNYRIDELAALIRPYVEADELKLYSTEEFERGLSKDIRVMGQWGGNNRAPGEEAETIEQERNPRAGVEQNVEWARRVGGGMTPIGLKSFVKERSVSVREQLAGKRESSSKDGSGNGAGSRMGGVPMGGNWR
jgi:spore coat protein CotH